VSGVRAEIVETVEDLEQHLLAWDELAAELRRPLCAPGWMLAWWRNAAPPSARLRTVLVRSGNRLVGIAPYFAQGSGVRRTDYRLLGSGVSQRITPLAAPGLEEEVAAAVAGALAGASPRPNIVTLEGVDAASPWPNLLARHWPGRLRPKVYRTSLHSAPIVTVGGRSFDEWMSGKSSNFRQQMRRLRRQLEAEDGEVRMAPAAELDRGLAAFARLHHARWAEDGGSGVLSEGVERMLSEAGYALAASERLRLWLVEVGGEPVSAQIFVAVGGEVIYWNGGFDVAWGKLKPGLQAVFAGVEDAFRRGEHRVDLGGGPQDYKLRLADDDDPLAWTGFVPRGARYPLTRAELLRTQLYATGRGIARRLLPRGAQRWLRRAVRRSG
jgi:CelD/BcsL family acetyltransferase involved in cellulose biosynthesis